MSYLVTLDVFSGRPNPIWLLDDKHSDELRERLAGLDERAAGKPSGAAGRLGYRGFRVREAGAGPGASFHVHDGLVDPGSSGLSLVDDGRALEHFLHDCAPENVDPELMDHVGESIEQPPFDLDDFLATQVVTCPPNNTVDAPAYNPGTWNTPAVQPYNNCYNYANNQITNTFAQPGRATGKPITSLSCAGVQPSAESDGLKPSANFSDPLKAGQGWYVALVIWPGKDYHWYRQDSNGCWSHKAGQGPATNLDNAGQPITDPKTANRGNYTDFCTYMITSKAVTIS